MLPAVVAERQGSGATRAASATGADTTTAATRTGTTGSSGTLSSPKASSELQEAEGSGGGWVLSRLGAVTAGAGATGWHCLCNNREGRQCREQLRRSSITRSIAPTGRSSAGALLLLCCRRHSEVLELRPRCGLAAPAGRLSLRLLAAQVAERVAWGQLQAPGDLQKVGNHWRLLDEHLHDRIEGVVVAERVSRRGVQDQAHYAFQLAEDALHLRLQVRRAQQTRSLLGPQLLVPNTFTGVHISQHLCDSAMQVPQLGEAARCLLVRRQLLEDGVHMQPGLIIQLELRNRGVRRTSRPAEARCDERRRRGSAVPATRGHGPAPLNLQLELCARLIRAELPRMWRCACFAATSTWRLDEGGCCSDNAP